MDNSQTENIASSLVREYLSRKGLKVTLQMLDREMPRTDDSISNRQALMKELNIEKLMKQNKELTDPLRTMLEIMTKYFLEKGSDESILNDSYSKSKRPSSSKSRHSLPSSNLLDLTPAADRPISSSTYSNSTRQKETTSTVTSSTILTDPPEQQSKSARGNRHGKNDIVIDDHVESETLLGEGKAGLLAQEESLDYVPTQRTTTTRPRSAKLKGLSGPISSNLDEPGRRKFHKPRPISSGSRGANISAILGEKKAAEEPKSVNTISVKESQDEKNFGEFDQMINKQRKTSIKDVLEVGSDRQRPSSSSRRQSSSEEEKAQYSVDKSSIAKRPPVRSGIERSSSSSSLSSKSTTKVGDIEFGDCDDLDNDLAELKVGPKLPLSQPVQNLVDARPIALQTAINLKTLVFGSANQSFNDEWKFQSFTYCDLPKLKYGIVQRKGGPCGVLAAVQACILQELLFCDCKIPLNKFSEPSVPERSLALATALAKIFWRAGDEKSAVVALPSGKPLFQGSRNKYQYDDLTETLMLNHIKSFKDLLRFLTQNIQQYETDGCSGVILALYSCIFSRYIDQIREDMDEPTGKLMGAHGYCSQEMVNLLLTGRAVSNVFNDTMTLGEGNDVTVLKGITRRSNIGFLSLFEFYKSCQVGTYYKTPKYPIWVVCSESHFSTLFSVKKDLVNDWKAERRFDLFYYDGLSRQQEEIKLTIETFDKNFRPPADEELVPPLEHCIRTKWSDAKVDWNDTEPLL